jgi:hypothetical protein
MEILRIFQYKNKRENQCNLFEMKTNEESLTLLDMITFNVQ